MPFVPAHAFMTGPDAQLSGWMLVLHGIYGRGGNWRSFARRLTEARPDWGIVLVDLRMHGHSLDAVPPHDLANAAADLETLAARIHTRGDAPVRVVSGHSFGGKVALRLRANKPSWLEQTWMIDSSPSAHPNAINEGSNSVVRVLRMLEALGNRFLDRDSFIEAVTDRGFEPMLARWLAMNLEQVEGAGDYRFTLDVAAMRSLLTDYYAQDLWDAVESGAGDLHAVAAGRSDSVSPTDRDRFRALQTEMSGAVRYHCIEDSGHWVHVDALEPLVTLVAAELPRS